MWPATAMRMTTASTMRSVMAAVMTAVLPTTVAGSHYAAAATATTMQLLRQTATLMKQAAARTMPGTTLARLRRAKMPVWPRPSILLATLAAAVPMLLLTVEPMTEMTMTPAMGLLLVPVALVRPTRATRKPMMAVRLKSKAQKLMAKATRPTTLRSVAIATPMAGMEVPATAELAELLPALQPTREALTMAEEMGPVDLVAMVLGMVVTAVALTLTTMAAAPMGLDPVGLEPTVMTRRPMVLLRQVPLALKPMEMR